MSQTSYYASHPYAVRMSALAASFPALNRWGNRHGIRPWDPEALAAQVGVMSHGEACVARFLLGVWTGTGSYPNVAPFDYFEAMGCWDREQREAFVAWTREPFWP
jgi:hypothetical protein